MKKLVLGLLFAFVVQASAFAQWQVPAGSIPVGKGPGFVGFNIVTGSGGGGTKCLLDTNPPTFGTCGGGGGGLTVGTTTIASGTDKTLLYNNAGILGNTAGVTYNSSGVFLTVSANASSSPPAIAGAFGTVASFIGSDTTRPSVSIQGFGAGAEPSILLMHARGTGAAPTASLSGDFIAELFSHPYATSASAGYVNNAGAGLIWVMTENATTTTAGEKIVIYTTPTGTATAAVNSTFMASGGLTIGKELTTTTGLLTVNKNTSTTPVSFSSVNPAPTIHLVGVDAASATIAAQSFSTGGGGFAVQGLSARGTQAAPTATQSGDQLLVLGGYGYATSGGAGYGSNAGASVVAAATENYTSSAFGAKLIFSTTPNTTSTAAVAMTVQASGGVSVGSAAADPGAGIINVTTGYRIANAAASGNVLRGNGTNFISAALAITDISGLGTGVATALGTAVNTNGGPLTGTTNSVAAGALVVGAGSGTAPTGVADVATGALLASGGVGSNPSYCTACSITTSVSTPTHTAPGVLTFQSNGSTFAGSISTGQVWLIGNTVTSPVAAGLTINRNATSTLVSFSSIIGAPTVHMIAADTTSATFAAQTFSAGGGFGFLGLSARGTQASPTATQSTDLLMGVTGYGYATSGGAGYVSNAGGGFQVVATENYTSTAGGSKVIVVATANGSSTSSQVAHFFGSSGFAIGAATDPGSGGLYVNGATITFNALATDATHTDRTVCQDTTSKSLFFGSGAAGICLGTSSARYKRDIEPLHAGLADIMGLVPKSFYYLPGYGDDGAKRQYGLVAEDVIKIMPQIVGLNESGQPNSVDWAALTPVMINAIRELKVANDNLREEVKTLKKRKIR